MVQIIASVYKLTPLNDELNRTATW